MQRPPYLASGDTIGIAAPARPVEPGQVAHFLKQMERAGFTVQTGEIYRRFRQFSGRDQERLQDLQQMMDDPDIRAIFCARGGYGSVRLTEELSLAGFRQSPKWLAGFSDITVLHQLIHCKSEVATLHAPMPYTLRGTGHTASASAPSGIGPLIGALQGEALDYDIPPHPLNRQGIAEGLLVGGNFSVLCSLMGTPYQPDSAGRILFLEEVDEYLYHLDRMLWNFRLAGVFEGLGGLILGYMTRMRDNEIPFGQEACEIIAEAVAPYDFPVCFGFPAGHEEPNLPMRLGHPARLEVQAKAATFHQEP